jgi:hypothetical protein
MGWACSWALELREVAAHNAVLSVGCCCSELPAVAHGAEEHVFAALVQAASPRLQLALPSPGLAWLRLAMCTVNRSSAEWARGRLALQ